MPRIWPQYIAGRVDAYMMTLETITKLHIEFDLTANHNRLSASFQPSDFIT